MRPGVESGQSDDRPGVDNTSRGVNDFFIPVPPLESLGNSGLAAAGTRGMRTGLNELP